MARCASSMLSNILDLPPPPPYRDEGLDDFRDFVNFIDGVGLSAQWTPEYDYDWMRISEHQPEPTRASREPQTSQSPGPEDIGTPFSTWLPSAPADDQVHLRPHTEDSKSSLAALKHSRVNQPFETPAMKGLEAELILSLMIIATFWYHFSEPFLLLYQILKSHLDILLHATLPPFSAASTRISPSCMGQLTARRHRPWS